MEVSIDNIKSTFFGGFDKESVLLYIRALMEFHEDEKTRLKNELDTLRKVNKAIAAQSRASAEQSERIVATIREQARNLDGLLAENKSLKAALDDYKTRENELAERELQCQEAAAATLAKAREESFLLKEAAEQEAKTLIRAMEDKLTAMAALSMEFETLCRRGEALITESND